MAILTRLIGLIGGAINYGTWEFGASTINSVYSLYHKVVVNPIARTLLITHAGVSEKWARHEEISVLSEACALGSWAGLSKERRTGTATVRIYLCNLNCFVGLALSSGAKEPSLAPARRPLSTWLSDPYPMSDR